MSRSPQMMFRADVFCAPNDMTLGASAQQNSPTEVRQQIEGIVRGWVMVFRAGDAKAAAPYFASPSGLASVRFAP